MNRLKEESGAVAIIMAICMVVLMGAVALSVDVGAMLLRRREMVNGADSAAHAGAVTYVATKGNVGAAQASSDVQFKANTPGAQKEGWSRTQWVLEPGSTLVEGTITVTYTSTTSLFFAPVFGFSSTKPVTTTASASWKSDGTVTGGTVYPDNPAAKKVYICKYVGKPGEDERLQTGQNPVEVARNKTKPYPVGLWFVDAQGRSFVLAPSPYSPPPTAADCPQPGPHVWLSN